MNNAKIIDLTLPIEDGGSSPPKMPKPVFAPVRTYEIDRCRTSTITLYNHSGTHLDAPSHFITDGPTIEKINIEDLICSAWVIDVSHIKYPKRIEVEDIQSIAEFIKFGDNILFNTGWSQFYPEMIYYRDYPTVSSNLAKWLVTKGIKLIGIDTGSIAAINNWDELVEVHKILLDNNLIIIEGLTNLDKLPFNQKVNITILPINLIGLDGGPVRAIAIL